MDAKKGVIFRVFDFDGFWGAAPSGPHLDLYPLCLVQNPRDRPKMGPNLTPLAARPPKMDPKMGHF